MVQSYSGALNEKPLVMGAIATTAALAGMASSVEGGMGTLKCTMENPITLSRPSRLTRKLDRVAVVPVMAAFTGMTVVVTARLSGKTSAATLVIFPRKEIVSSTVSAAALRLEA